jgi:6-phosphogluconolactonase
MALGDAVADVLADKSRATLALSGGRSPQAVLPLLAAQAIDWSRVDVTLIDERCVGPDDDASNAGMVRAHFLDRGAAAARFVPLWSGQHATEPAAMAAGKNLNGILPADIAYFGMGADGHIASLFPAAEVAAFESADSTAILSEAPAPPRERISLTLTALLASRRPFLHVSGGAKVHVLSEALQNPPTPAVPVSLLVHARPDLQVFAYS